MPLTAEIRKLSNEIDDKSKIEVRRSIDSNSTECEEKVLNQYLDDEYIKEALQSGLDLREFAKNIEEKLKIEEKAAVNDYIAQADDLALLHNEISDCDKVLEDMEHLLGGFQSDLGAISSDIQKLQEHSVLMNKKLKNRQAARGELSQFVDDMAISHGMIHAMMEKNVTSREFLEQLHELQHKIQFVRAQEFKDARAALDVHHVVQNLKFKAMEKIRDFLLQKISQFRKPLTNYQIPQNSMLKDRFFYEFLLANDREIAKEIRDEYVDTASKMFFSYFKTYTSRLLKLQHDDTATKDDLLGAEDTIRIPGFFSSKPQIVRRYAEFTLALLLTNRYSGSAINDRLQALITRLQAEIEQLLNKIAMELMSKKQQLICLINNYDLILCVLTEKLSEETRESVSFKELEQTQINRYVEEILFPHFGALLNFVVECEPLIDQGHVELLRRYTEKVPNIIRSFGSDWKKSIDQINQEVMRSFTNFRNGTNILQAALTQLVQYYHRFQNVLSHSAFSGCSAKNDLVNIHHIMVELKKYKPVF